MSGLIKLVRVYDPAYAGSVPIEAMRAYISSRDFDDLPALPPGSKAPVVFHCKRLTRAQLRHADHGATDEERASRAFACGVLRVTGGSFGDGWKPSNADDARRVHMPDDEREEQFEALDEEEIGGVIYTLSKFPLDCSPLFLLRHLSGVAWDGNARRYAAAKRPARPSSAPPEGE